MEKRKQICDYQRWEILSIVMQDICVVTYN